MTSSPGYLQELLVHAVGEDSDRASRQAPRLRIVLAVRGAPCLDQGRSRRLIRQTTLETPADVDELLPYGGIRTAFRRAGAVVFPAPDSGEIGLAIGCSRRGGGEVRFSVGEARDSRCGVIQPLPGRAGQQANSDHDRDRHPEDTHAYLLNPSGILTSIVTYARPVFHRSSVPHFYVAFNASGSGRVQASGHDRTARDSRQLRVGRGRRQDKRRSDCGLFKAVTGPNCASPANSRTAAGLPPLLDANPGCRHRSRSPVPGPLTRSPRHA